MNFELGASTPEKSRKFHAEEVMNGTVIRVGWDKSCDTYVISLANGTDGKNNFDKSISISRQEEDAKEALRYASIIAKTHTDIGEIYRYVDEYVRTNYDD